VVDRAGDELDEAVVLNEEVAFDEAGLEEVVLDAGLDDGLEDVELEEVVLGEDVLDEVVLEDVLEDGVEVVEVVDPPRVTVVDPVSGIEIEVVEPPRVLDAVVLLLLAETEPDVEVLDD
jgi:hypothetical protein